MKEYILYIAGFIGIAINIWIDTPDDGGGVGPGPLALKDRANNYILNRSGTYIFTRV